MGASGTCAGNLKLVGGRLCLDFANTVDWHARDHPEEWLTSYSDLVAWAAHAGALTDSEAESLLREAARQPREAASVLERAVALREAVYRVFSAVVAGRSPRDVDLATINEALTRATAYLEIVAAPDGFEWRWRGEGELDRMLWPVVRSAADLLTSKELERVRECPADGCGWLFVDASRNRTRKWCSMDDCGNRTKARKHYRRARGRRSEEAIQTPSTCRPLTRPR